MTVITVNILAGASTGTLINKGHFGFPLFKLQAQMGAMGYHFFYTVDELLALLQLRLHSGFIDAQ